MIAMKKLLQNWPLRLLSVLAAVILWFVIMNYADPGTTRKISYIPITLVHEDLITASGKAYKVVDTLYASVKVTGTSSVIATLVPSDFTAIADVSQMFDMTGQVPVTVSCNRSEITDSKIENLTKSIKLEMENIQTRRFTVEVDTAGKIAEGFLMGKTIIDPARITVTAPESVMNNIARAAVSINVDGLSEPAEYVSEIQLFNDSGTALNLAGTDNFSVSADTARITAEVLSVKTIPIVYKVEGQNEVAAGYRFTGAELSVSSVQVSGLKSRLAELSTLTIPDGLLNVKDAGGDVELTLDLSQYLPDTVTIVDRDSALLKITLKVEMLTTQIVDVANKIEWEGMDDAYEYRLKDSSVRVFFRALKEDFNHFSDALVKVSVDVTGLEPGQYSLPLKVTVSDSVFELVNEPTITLDVVDADMPESSSADGSEKAG